MESKVAKVITVCFKPRLSHGVAFGPGRLRKDRNELATSQSALDMFKFILEKEKIIDSGLSMDTIIVNNNFDYTIGNDYLASMDGTTTKNGVFKVIQRENVGLSFGGFNAAFQKYKNEYEYWLFSEDDLYYSKDGYAKGYLDILNENYNCAFVATIGIGRPNHETKHAHGGQGFTHRKYMEETIELEFNLDDGTNKQACKTAGSLAYYDDRNAFNHRLHCICGEVPFTYSLVRLGYDICVDENPEEWYRSYDEK